MDFAAPAAVAAQMDLASHGLAAAGHPLGKQQHELWASVPLLLLAVAVWALEQRRRAGAAGAGQGAAAGGLSFAWCGSALRSLAPELCGLAFIAAQAFALLARGGNNGAVITSADDHQLWQDIRAEWPLLTTADSLLALQAALRVLLISSAVLRRSECRASPLAGEALVLFFLAAAARVALLALSPQDVYHLDGPLGGLTSVALEVASLALLAGLVLHMLRQGGPKMRPRTLAAAVLVAVWAAGSNRLALADPQDVHLDVLFSLVQLLELLAATAFLARTVSSPASSGNAFAAFAHALLPAQQLLPAYFLLTAWGAGPLETVPELVGAGWPFQLLQLCGAAQVGVYLVAAAAHLAFCSEQKDGGLYLEV